MSSIQGNTRAQSSSATANRNNTKQLPFAVLANALPVVFAVGSAVIFTVAGISFFWKLLAAIILLKAADVVRNAKNAKSWLAPTLRGFGWGCIAAIVLSSGFGQWTAKTVNGWEHSVRCATDSNTKDCTQLAATENVIKSNVATDCTQNKGIIDVFPEGKKLVVCNDTNRLLLMPVQGHILAYDFDPEFKERNKHRNLRVEDYVAIQTPFTFAGSIANSYQLQLRPSVPQQYTAGWQRTPDITSVVIFVRAVPPPQ